jgi:outer membrane protein assembly factor BamB
MHIRKWSVVSLLVCGALALASQPGAAGPTDWPQFRGPGGLGVADAAKLPERWSATSNVAWTTEIPGRGWSSPIVWRDRVYITSAISPGAFKAPSTGIFGNDYIAELTKQGLPPAEVSKRVVARDIELAGETGDISYMVYALDAKSGKVIWQHEAYKGKPFGGRHRKNTYASETPVTDGERLYVSFGGNVGVYAYSLDGKPLWKKNWPPHPIYLDFGTASSPIVHDGRVYQLHDNDRDAFFAALDAKTGEEIWNVKRTAPAPGSRKSGWATPFVWQHQARTEIVTMGVGFAISYDRDGKELWRLKGFVQATPSPVAADGLLYVGSGSQGESNRPIYAIKPGATGDITLAADQTSSEFVAWFQPRMSAYTGSPLVYRGRIYAINDNGVLQVADAKTGTEVYKVRLGGAGNTFSSSPLASNGRIYVLTEEGDTVVFEAGDQYKEIAKNSLGEMSFASPAVDANSFYLRTATKLYKISGR